MANKRVAEEEAGDAWRLPATERGDYEEPEPPFPNTVHIIEPHVHGECCARYFFSLMTEGSHRDRISIFQEEGHSDEQTLIALLKTVLDSGVWHGARSFMDEAGIDAKRGRGEISPLTACQFCAREFPATRTGQRFCCNACAYRAEGLSPVVPHEDGCPAWERQAA